MTEQNIHTSIETARAEARAVCENKGSDSQECAAAWDAVEELQAAAAHQQTTVKTPMQIYCEENPDAAECRIYED